MKDLDLLSLRCFVSVCELASISRAADQQNVVTSAVSKRLKQLEEQLGVVLLARRRNGVVPTAAGKLLLERSRSLLASASDISREISSFADGVRGKIHLMAAMSMMVGALPDDIAAFLALPEYRSVQVEIEEALNRNVAKKVRNGTAAAGVIWDTGDLEGLETRTYRNDSLTVVVHASHPLAQRVDCTFADTLAYERVGLQFSSSINETLARAAIEAGATPAYRAMVSTFDACIRIVRANLALSIIPEPIARNYQARGGICVIPLRDGWAQRRFVICFRDYAKLSRPTAALVDFLHQSALQESGVSPA